MKAEMLNFVIFIVLSCHRMESAAQLTADKDMLLNWCLNTTSHKSEPGKEDSLYGECIPWKDHSCCTEDTSHNVHHLPMYNFTLDHCYDEKGEKMSDGCRRHFMQNNCFYECEPHIGLWVVKTTRKIGDERFYKVPLCASDCETWWEACKDDFTCVYNWPRDFKFQNGHNTCPIDAKCQTFQAIYKTSQDFCENVWDHSWEYTNDDRPCMRIWFNGTLGNPNRQTAEFYVDRRFNGSERVSASVALQLIFISLCYLLSS